MSEEMDDPIWTRLSRALFGLRRTTDEGLFTYGVMEEIRRLAPAFSDLAWRSFRRWALPLLGVGAAGLVLAARLPAPPLSIDTVVLQQQTADADPLSPVLEDFQ